MYKLTSYQHSLATEITNRPDVMFGLKDKYNSPLNIVLPQVLDENINGYGRVFDKHKVSGQVYFAHKANKSMSLLRKAATQKCNVDVASVGELQNALSCKFTPDRIEATGPKNKEFIQLALKNSVLINLDSLSELEIIIEQKKVLNVDSPIKILIRIEDFHSTKEQILSRQSRFGVAQNQILDALDICVQNKKDLTLLGFSFHLDTTEIRHKVIAIENCLEWIQKAQTLNLNPHVINIGGGFKANYLESETEWEKFKTILNRSLLGEIPSITWNNYGFGLRVEGNKIHGMLNSYSFYNKTWGSTYLDELLSTPSKANNNRPIGTILSENMVYLYIEPGRALTAHAGITLAEVIATKTISTGDQVIVLDMNQSNLLFRGQEMFVDPILIPQKKTPAEKSIGVYFVGNLCLETDVLYRHKTFLDQVPRVGDLVVFLNTGAYYMDFDEAHSLQQRTATKIAVEKVNDKFVWQLDNKYDL